MVTITDSVRSIMLEDDIGLQAAQTGLLNLSAYAEKILPIVEEKAQKKVKKGSLVVALSRVVEEISKLPNLRPQIVLEGLSIKSPLCDITFSKTELSRQKLSSLQQNIEISENAFFTSTQSMSEITIIAPQSLLNDILKHFGETPLIVYKDRTGVTVRFAKTYLAVPNVLYALQASLAVHRINFTEVVSTYTEFSFIIDKKDLETATQALQKFLK
jgi:aspartokinase